MRTFSLLPTGAFALTANAFLVPLEVAKTATSASTIGGKAFTYAVDCSTCPFALESKTEGVSVEWTNAVKSDLIINFEIHDNVVFLNDLPMMDSDMNNAGLRMHVKQIAKDGEIKAEGEGVQWKPFPGDLGMTYSTYHKVPKVESTPEGDIMLWEFDMQIVGIYNQEINPNAFQLQILKSPVGEIHLKSVEPVKDFLPMPTSTCHSLLCRLYSAAAAKVSAAKARLGLLRPFKGCGGKKAGGIASHPKGPKVKGGLPKFADKFPPAKEHHHRHRGLFTRVLDFIYYASIYFGLGFAALSLTVFAGAVAVGIIRAVMYALRDGRTNAYARVEQGEAGEDSDMPPKYEDVDSLEAVIVEEKK
ncbi:hypothetical protein MMC25_003575 [Agyrium rufum]|nr:hypothetical protein [Agyrium rufum]